MTMAEDSQLVAGWKSAWRDVVRDWHTIEQAPMSDAWLHGWGAAESDYASLVEARLWLRKPWSVMGVLGAHQREIPHNKMLAWFLDPAGGHGLGDAPLRGILDHIGVSHRRHDLAMVRVRREVAVETTQGPGLIDVLVEWAGQALVIECKVAAGVHGAQLAKYSEAYPSATRVFLTPSGRKPSDAEALGKRWEGLSWRSDLVPLLRSVATDARALGQRCPALEDYVTTLEKEMP